MGEDETSIAKAREIARAILRYLEIHPDAKDTLEGIAKWWLWLELNDQLRGEVEKAVSLLVSRGFILETRREGVPTYYKLNPEKRKDLSILLEGS